jgi:hypothetical protein
MQSKNKRGGREPRQSAIKMADKPAKRKAGKRSGQYAMKGFVSVTDNEWFEFLSQQPDIDGRNSALFQRSPNNVLIIHQIYPQSFLDKR